ncbi:MAG: hypothetical protein COV29_00180 [Candidatus Yanofskybacteria bacterium CG10_big_fil_rev_8_21_14_0_10_36_16]|uniref:Uncharacterized protein n=1 Tax=Candidatus Yanofskybacteria bacterium CG10_big_fil_rev_8_21_14_0_10_36_16 TaxID=1975096 RepID=A0A2J0QC47_9BACT|nr:MAG: hypothetical protein COV29_00180 [Candidatus Yanofskybacteria bacterium CG10_big_fil_rev_8_21_14_0_10_36_16]
MPFAEGVFYFHMASRHSTYRLEPPPFLGPNFNNYCFAILLAIWPFSQTEKQKILWPRLKRELQ